uniref:Uncharacterized protein n=1 Tax=Neobodo designis TaxID=312471 RepID=A0A7S1MI77_NEODS|mmetsp:Transcript_41161/g.127111  ORF Transcript_41161/g.127111 Transcript_41161/m.127111 type:complete len:240 (+) Transcript_41161:85-804(+)
MPRGPHSQPNAANVIKLVLAGDAGVGKTLLARQLASAESGAVDEPVESTVGVDFFTIDVTTRDGLRVAVQLWDTAGQERFRAISKTTFRGAHAVVVLYDVTDVASFNNVADWVATVNAIAPRATIAVVGNKTDLEHLRAVPHGYGAALAERLSVDAGDCVTAPIRHFEISSYTRHRLDAFVCETVSDAADALLARATEAASRQNSTVLSAPKVVETRDASKRQPASKPEGKRRGFWSRC